MQEERLLRGIRSWERSPQRRAREEPHRTIDSVREHLQKILNNRKKNVMFGEDYGFLILSKHSEINPIFPCTDKLLDQTIGPLPEIRL